MRWAAHFVEVCCYLHAKLVLACLGRLDDWTTAGGGVEHFSEGSPSIVGVLG